MWLWNLFRYYLTAGSITEISSPFLDGGNIGHQQQTTTSEEI